MQCENIFCIYNSENKCILECVSLDILGQCTACIYATIDDEILEEAKRKTLESVERDY